MPKPLSKIRRAKFTDIREITRLSEQAYQRSRFANRFAFEPVGVKKAALEMIHNHATDNGAGAVFVADNGNALEGVFVGVVNRLYEGLDAYIASNLIWYTEPGANAFTGVKFLKAFESWIDRFDAPVLIRIALSDAVENPQRMSKILARSGYRNSGLIFEKETS